MVPNNKFRRTLVVNRLLAASGAGVGSTQQNQHASAAVVGTAQDLRMACPNAARRHRALDSIDSVARIRLSSGGIFGHLAPQPPAGGRRSIEKWTQVQRNSGSSTARPTLSKYLQNNRETLALAPTQLKLYPMLFEVVWGLGSRFTAKVRRNLVLGTISKEIGSVTS